MYVRPYCPVVLSQTLVLCAVIQEKLVDNDNDNDDDDDDDDDGYFRLALIYTTTIHSDPTRTITDPTQNENK